MKGMIDQSVGIGGSAAENTPKGKTVCQFLLIKIKNGPRIKKKTESLAGISETFIRSSKK
jgi:hypothetical protein